MSKPTHFSKHGGLFILSVDDDQVNLLVLEQLLAPEGWKVVSAGDGEEAFEILEEEDSFPDFIFLDYCMNVGDSGDLICKKMRALFGGTPVPIVMCTAMGEGSDALQQCMAAGASDVLLKPYEREKMLQMVHKHCGKMLASGTQQAAEPQQASPAGGPDEVLAFCVGLGLEFVGKKLAGAGCTMGQLLEMDDQTLRKAGVVVAGQRGKILEEVAKLRQ